MNPGDSIAALSRDARPSSLMAVVSRRSRRGVSERKMGTRSPTPWTDDLHPCFTPDPVVVIGVALVTSICFATLSSRAESAQPTGRASVPPAVSVWPGAVSEPRLHEAWQALGADDIDRARALISGLEASLERTALERALTAQTAIAPPTVTFDKGDGRTPSRFRAARNRTPLITVRANDVDLEVGLDTGAGLSVITETVARKIRAVPFTAASPQTIDSLGESVASRMATISLGLSGAEFRDLVVLVVPDERLRASLLGITLFSFDGLLGWNALKLTRTEIDFAQSTLSISSASTTCGMRNLWSVGYQPLIEATVNGQPLLALIDSGARSSSLTDAGVSAISNPDVSDRTRIAAGASGVKVRATSTLANAKVSIGGHEVGLSELPVRPIRGNEPLQRMTVGMDVLQGTRLILDGPCGEFSVEKN